MPRFRFDNSYVRLPGRFYARLDPTPVAAPKLIRVNHALAEELGLDSAALETPAGVAVLAGNAVPEGAEPLAQAYSGHQFGGFSPLLGDGRAILLGEVVGRDGARRDIQLKGSGPTPFSRRGDGRAALGPVLREYIVSEAMTALGIPSTRALAAVTTGETVLRERALPGGVFTRVAASHLRVGTFQFFAARRDEEGLRTLLDYAIARHDPAAAQSEDPALAFYSGVVRRQAALVAQWLLVGFVHGVMNTDNTSISGETIDFGPCAFMEAFDPATVFSSIDHGGRYAYGNQPGIMQWNLARLAECLLPLLSLDEEAAVDKAQQGLAGFAPAFEAAYHTGLRRKIGLATAQEGDMALIQDLLGRMAAERADFTLTFRRLGTEAGPRTLFRDPSAFDGWAESWRARLAREGVTPDQRRDALNAVNPAFIPRNHKVEAAIAAAVEREDFAPFHEMVDLLATPFTDKPGFNSHAEPAPPGEEIRQTFCGT
ncbi:protein adenylyltransferase SelO [Teichococcus globiformis]